MISWLIFWFLFFISFFIKSLRNNREQYFKSITGAHIFVVFLIVAPVAVTIISLDKLDPLHIRTSIALSIFLTFGFVGATNRHLLGFFSIALGALMNALVIYVNGYMPVYDSRASFRYIHGPATENTIFPFLSDWINLFDVVVASPGDFLLEAGLVLIVIQILFWKKLPPHRRGDIL